MITMIALLLFISMIAHAVTHGYWLYLVLGMLIMAFLMYMEIRHPLSKTGHIPDSMCVNRCPKCYSTHVFPTTKGFSILQAIIGGSLIGHTGFLGGFIGASSRRFQCAHCGNVYKYSGLDATSDRINQKDRMLLDPAIRKKFNIK